MSDLEECFNVRFCQTLSVNTNLFFSVEDICKYGRQTIRRIRKPSCYSIKKSTNKGFVSCRVSHCGGGRSKPFEVEVKLFKPLQRQDREHGVVNTEVAV